MPTELESSEAALIIAIISLLVATVAAVATLIQLSWVKNLQTVRKLPEFGVKQREERAVRESERLGLIGRLTRPKRRPGPQCAPIEPRNPSQAATAAVMASTPRMLSARRKL